MIFASFHLGKEEVINIFRKLTVSLDEIKMIFTHASSKKAWEECGDVLGVSSKMFHIYEDFGNLVSASVPAAISIAMGKGRVSSGDKLIAWVGSAGMSFASISFSL